MTDDINNDLLNLLQDELNRAYKQTGKTGKRALQAMPDLLIEGEDIKCYIANNPDIFTENNDISVEINDSCYLFFKNNKLSTRRYSDEYETIIDTLFDKLYNQH